MLGQLIKEWWLLVSSAIFLYFQITLTGVVIAAASFSFSSVINAPTPQIYPVVGRTGIVAAVALWLFSGPIAFLRFGVALYNAHAPYSLFSFMAIAAALVWAFCLGVLVLELVFQLFFG